VGDGAPVEVAAELEGLGYTALWSTGGFRAGLSSRFGRLLAATERMAVVSGIASIWITPPDVMARAVADLDGEYPGRFVLGLGVSHAPIVADYVRPLDHMAQYLDGLDGNGAEVAKDRRLLAALGPRMLALAAERSAGAHPYFVPAEHTARAREVLGAGALLAPEVSVVLEPDAATARQVAREFTAGYLTLANYAGNLRRLGYTEDDLADGGSDRLVDAVVAWGDSDHVVEHVRRHVEAGADHVCIQVLAPLETFPIDAYRELAPGLVSL
jgi:probable F420-dependent oxidoreductase